MSTLSPTEKGNTTGTNVSEVSPENVAVITAAMLAAQQPNDAPVAQTPTLEPVQTPTLEPVQTPTPTLEPVQTPTPKLEPVQAPTPTPTNQVPIDAKVANPQGQTKPQQKQSSKVDQIQLQQVEDQLKPKVQPATPSVVFNHNSKKDNDSINTSNHVQIHAYASAAAASLNAGPFLDKCDPTVVTKLLASCDAFLQNIEKKNVTIDLDLAIKGVFAKNQEKNENSSATSRSIKAGKAGKQLVRDVVNTTLHHSSAYYFEISRFYFDDFRRKMQYVTKWNDIIIARNKIYDAETNSSKNIYANRPRYETHLKEFKSLQELIDQLNNIFQKKMQEIEAIFIKTWNSNFFGNKINLTGVSSEWIEGQRAKVASTILKQSKKLSSLYHSNSKMEVFLDSKFMVIYILKIVTFAVLVGALFLSQTIFLEMYMKKVYAENSDPPSLLTMLGITIGFDLVFMLFLLTVLILIVYTVGSPAGDFIINAHTIKTFFYDYFVYFFFVIVISAIIGGIIERKKYFRYKTEGLRAIRAYTSTIMGISGILLLVPFFAIF